MNSPVVLAYSGTLEASAAIPWLAQTYRIDVVTLTLDLGQEQPVEQLRARALACGASRAHVADARDEFVRDCVVAPLRRAPGARLAVASIARPLIARRVVEFAAAQGAAAIAHASGDEAFHEAIEALGPPVPVIAPAREWTMDAAQLASYARAHGLPHVQHSASGSIDHLLIRRVCDPAVSPEGTARLELTFDDDIPVALNGVEMSTAELIESLSLIGGQYGLGWSDEVPAPGAVVLEAAYNALREPAGVVTLRVSRSDRIVVASDSLVSVA